ncbi:type II secretion system secretin GspD [Luteimonas mephitis]|uniref:type II secretion system secretin GspD n=1 Tax=Luteimonas mephitis TaxID=83615 RepID=UPI000410951C|nr:type II secretion system secretin GspD [Luteimonas mephitis]
MNQPSLIKAFAAALFATLLAGCSTMPAPELSRQGDRAAVAGAGHASAAGPVVAEELAAADAGLPQAQIRRGSGQTINSAVAASTPPNLVGTTGETTFNFEGESLQAVIKAILGDMLGQNYVIAPGVQGTVTYVTSKPVSPAEALSLLEMVLGWNNARMIYSDGRYNIVPADTAMATGAVAPRTGSPVNARGFESRVVQLQYISATEMEKILKPYARPNSIVNVDPGRNVITVAGSRTELENYLRTIRIFDVDWMSSMSVGVFPLQNGKASKVVQDLEKVFGEQSKTPVAGMFRFMPLEGANAVLVITPQASYLDQIQQWLERIDGAGAGVQLFSYELKYIKAKDLADRLSEVFGGGSSGGGRSTGGDGNVSLMPGSDAYSISGSGSGDRNGDSLGAGDVGSMGGDSGGAGGGLGEGSLRLNPRQGGNGSVTLEVEGDRVGVSAVDETNTLLVRTTSRAWKSIRDVVERLDVMPMQVHIEAQIAEVTLTGDLKYGVNWYFERAVTDAGLPNAVGRDTWSTIAGSVLPATTTGGGLSWTFLGRNAAAVINALDEVTDVQILQSPSVMVRNNAEATFNVGSKIPISSVSFDPGTGSTGVYNNVQYMETGTILNVRPRVTKDGMVFLDIVQEVSTPGNVPDKNGNVRVDTRKLKTEAAVRSGDTVMLAGLIRDEVGRGSSGFPGLSRIPIIGGLFGQQKSSTGRSEVIILLTPVIIRSAEEAADLTDEYSRRFRAMEPLNPKRKK